MSRDHRDNSANSTNAPIITTNQAELQRPRNLLDAISDIQQYYVIEVKGQEIPAEFLTISRTLELFKVGVKSGFYEGITLALMSPFFAFYLFPFILRSPDLTTRILFGIMPYMMLVINTLLCSYISRYYVGAITRKSINALFGGRTMSLLIKAFLIYIFYYVLYRLSTPAHVWEVARHFGSWSQRIYYGYLDILPKLMPVATEITSLMAVAAVVPYGMSYLLDIWHRYKVKKNALAISGR